MIYPGVLQATVRDGAEVICEGKLDYTEVAPATDKSQTVAVEVERGSRFTRPPQGSEGCCVVGALDQLQAKVMLILEAFQTEFGKQG